MIRRTLPVVAWNSKTPNFVAGGRDALYYVRAIQHPTQAINAAALRCEGEGCESVRPCHGDWRTSDDDDCLSETEERAWSSPIFPSIGQRRTSPDSDQEVP